jgi:hypothetical protein
MLLGSASFNGGYMYGRTIELPTLDGGSAKILTNPVFSGWMVYREKRDLTGPATWLA